MPMRLPLSWLGNDRRLVVLVSLSLLAHLLLLTRVSPPRSLPDVARIVELSVTLQPFRAAAPRPARRRAKAAPSDIAPQPQPAPRLRLDPDADDRTAHGWKRRQFDAAPLDNPPPDAVQTVMGRLFNRGKSAYKSQRLNDGQTLVRYALADGSTRCFLVRERDPLGSWDNGAVVAGKC